jgi:hypothetical protein
LTTALGLVVALITLFPYMIFKGQVDRAIGRVETLVAAAQQGFGTQSVGQRASVEIDVAPSRRSGGAVAAKSSA